MNIVKDKKLYRYFECISFSTRKLNCYVTVTYFISNFAQIR